MMIRWWLIDDIPGIIFWSLSCYHTYVYPVIIIWYSAHVQQMIIWWSAKEHLWRIWLSLENYLLLIIMWEGDDHVIIVWSCIHFVHLMIICLGDVKLIWFWYWGEMSTWYYGWYSGDVVWHLQRGLNHTIPTFPEWLKTYLLSCGESQNWRTGPQ